MFSSVVSRTKVRSKRFTLINFKTDLMLTFVSYAFVFFRPRWKSSHGRLSIKKWKHTLLHGGKCTHVKGNYFVEKMQINMIFAVALHILYICVSSQLVVVVVVIIGGRGGEWLLFCMIVKTTVIQIQVNYNGVLMMVNCSPNEHVYLISLRYFP